MRVKKVVGWLYKRLLEAVSLWPVLVPAGAVGVMTGYLSSFAEAVSAYGAFGWWSCGLLAFVFSSFAFAALAYGWATFKTVSALKGWSQKVDGFNPLDREFRHLRIKLTDLAHPTNNRISDKRIVDCELIGPAVIMLSRGSMTGGFMNCDVIAARDGAFVQNVIVIDNCEIISGVFYNCTVYLFEGQAVEMARARPGMVIVSRTGDAEIDARRGEPRR